MKNLTRKNITIEEYVTLTDLIVKNGKCVGETIEARPEMKKLLADVKMGKWKGVLVVEVERLARGETMDQGIVAQAFKISETKIITLYSRLDMNNPNSKYSSSNSLFGS